MTKRLAIAAAVTLLTLSAPGLAQTWTIPGTVNASGLNGTKFVSDLAITNPGTAPVVATLALVPANGTSAVQVLLNPGQTIVDRNLLQARWGASGAAATVVSAVSPLLIRARTYNTAQAGTYGVALPVVAADRMLSPGDTGDSLWIAQSADGSTGYRTNVAVVFPDAAGGDASVTIYDSNGTASGAQDFSLAAAGFQQFAVSAFAGAVSVGRAQITVTRGHAAAYAVVVDNVSGDSSLFSFENLPAGRQDVLVNGVARANGRNGTFFRTDARIYNPTSADAPVTVAFHANQSANPSPATATFNVPGGQIRDVVDVLQSLLGLPVGSAGALRFTSDSPLALLCRTSNVDPTGANPGTYGAQQKPTPLLSFLTSADAGAAVTGIRQGAAFRTNVGFAAGAEGASYNLTLKNAAGGVVGTGSGSLGPWGWTQPNVQDLFPTASVPEDATLLVNVTAGGVDVFDSSIDNASGDPVVTPIMPLPATFASSATIGPAGGSVSSADGRLMLLVPAGALAAATNVSIAMDASDAPQSVGPAYVLGPAGVTFAKPVLARFSYGPSDVAGSGEAGLAIATRQPDGWYCIKGGLLDTGRRTLSVVLPAGAPAAAARRALDNWSERLAILQAWQIQPKKVSVLGGGTLDFVAYYAGPPTSTVCLSPFCSEKAASPYTVQVRWYVGGYFGGFSTVGTVSPDTGTSTKYTAPCGYKAPIGVSFKIADPRISWANPDIRVEHVAVVNVFARKWQLTMEQKRTGLCPTGFFWNWTSRAVDEFNVKDGGGAAAGLQRVDGNGILNAVEGCLSQVGCTFDIPDEWPLLTIDTVEAGLDPVKGMIFSVGYTEEARIVGYTATCNGITSPPHPSEPGPSWTTADLVVGTAGDSRRVPDNDDNYVKWTFTPVIPCN